MSLPVNSRTLITAALIMAAVLLSACSGTPTPPEITGGPMVVTANPTFAAALNATQVSQPANNQTEIAATVAAVLTGTTAPATLAADDRPTLPPTWTPTFTPTDSPSTATITPSRTPTVTPTLSEVAICDAFFTVNNLKPGQVLAWKSKITLYLNAVPPDAKVRFLAVNHFSQKNLGADLPGGQSNILELPVSNLPGTGQYDWTLVVKTTNYGDICKQSGWFLAAGPASTRAEESSTR